MHLLHFEELPWFCNYNIVFIVVLIVLRNHTTEHYIKSDSNRLKPKHREETEGEKNEKRENNMRKEETPLQIQTGQFSKKSVQSFCVLFAHS